MIRCWMSFTSAVCFSLFCLLLFVPNAKCNEHAGALVARWTPNSIQLDGHLDEGAWAEAAWSGQFVDIVNGEPGWFQSRCAVLWDDDFLYVGFRLEEPSLRANLKERDAPVYRDNDVEVFLSGPNAYYELEVNTFGTVYDVFWVWEDTYGHGGSAVPWDDLDHSGVTMRIDGIAGHVHPRGWRTGFISWNMPELEVAVQTEGTINTSDDSDLGWTVEIAVPWAGLRRLVPEGTDWPPLNDEVALRVDCSRFQQYSEDDKLLERPVGWALQRHGAFDSHMPERFLPLELAPRPGE